MTKSFPKIYTAKKKDILKINNFNNNYFYKKKRNIEQFNWLFKSKFNNIKNYYYAKKNNKIIGTLGFVPSDFISDKKKIISIKPEDLLMNIDGIRLKLLDKIYFKFESKLKNKENVVLYTINNTYWAFKRLGFKINFGTKERYKKFFSFSSIFRSLDKKNFFFIFKYFLSLFIFFYSKIFSLNFFFYSDDKLKFVSYKKVPNWSDKIFENFVKYWKYFTIHRSKNFLHWRIFNNPFVKNYFVGLHLNKKPLGYFIYKIINKKIEIIDILIIPYNKKYNTIYLIDQILVYIDKISFKNKIEDCNFDFYLKNKLNKIIKDRLIKFGYFKKKELSDFSIKLFSSKLNKDFDKKFYITNINKAGRKY